jgi:hypothetical protein
MHEVLRGDGKRACGARCKRTGDPCRGLATVNGRCRMHGGKSTGPRILKAGGLYSKEPLTRASAIAALVEETRGFEEWLAVVSCAFEAKPGRRLTRKE